MNGFQLVDKTTSVVAGGSLYGNDSEHHGMPYVDRCRTAGIGWYDTAGYFDAMQFVNRWL
jgi:hypothetical protein